MICIDATEKEKLASIYNTSTERYFSLCTIPGESDWNYVVLTASNAEQGKWFSSEIEERKRHGFLPSTTVFGVVPDPVGERVGNGGAVMGALRFVAEQEGRSDFKGLKILVVLSSGDAKRVAQYSPVGKVFSPVPRLLKNGRTSTLFDEIMMSVSGIPSSINEGCLILSGDVLLVFDSSTFRVGNDTAAALAFKSSPVMGTGHGFFREDENGSIKNVWHKLSVEKIKAIGAEDENGQINLDTGAVFFLPKILSGLFSLIVDEEGKCTEESFHSFVNGIIAPSLYVDFFYPLAVDSTFDGYLEEIPEGKMCEELLEARKRIWNILRQWRIKLEKKSPALFIDFGTTEDVLSLMTREIDEYSFLGWKKRVNSRSVSSSISLIDSFVGEEVETGKDSFYEYSVVEGNSKIGNGVILSFTRIKNLVIPNNVVISSMRCTDGNYVSRLFSPSDNPKLDIEGGACLFGTRLRDLIPRGSDLEGQIWKDGEEKNLWNARLFEKCASIDDSVKSGLEIYEAVQYRDLSSVSFENRTSLSESFNNEDGSFYSDWLNRLVAIR